MKLWSEFRLCFLCLLPVLFLFWISSFMIDIASEEVWLSSHLPLKLLDWCISEKYVEFQHGSLRISDSLLRVDCLFGQIFWVCCLLSLLEMTWRLTMRMISLFWMLIFHCSVLRWYCSATSTVWRLETFWVSFSRD